MTATLTNQTNTMQTPTNYSYLKQRHLLFGSREFIIQGNDSLLVRESSLAHHHETLIPLNLMQATPTHSSSFAVKWLLTSLFMGTITGLMYFWASRYDVLILYVLTAILAGTTLVVLYRFFLYTTRLTIFRHVGTNENFLYLWRNRPDKRQFEGFVETLTRLIREQEMQERFRKQEIPQITRKVSEGELQEMR